MAFTYASKADAAHAKAMERLFMKRDRAARALQKGWRRRKMRKSSNRGYRRVQARGASRFLRGTGVSVSSVMGFLRKSVVPRGRIMKESQRKRLLRTAYAIRDYLNKTK